MKNKAIISLILMVAMVLVAATAIADNFAVNPLTDVLGGGWSTTAGSFNANAGNDGIISTTPLASRAVHPVTTNPSGAFTFESTWKVNNKSCDVHPGVSTGEMSGDICVGWNAPMNTFIVVKDNSQILANLGDNLGDTLDPNAPYTTRITSTDGNTFVCGVYKDGALVGHTATVSGFKPNYVALWIENYYPTTTDGPTINSVNFQSAPDTSPTPSPSPSPSPTTQPNSTTRFTLDLQAIREFYANQPIVHMSNQSVIYNPDGTVKQVITGNQTIASPTATPTSTAMPNATATTMPAQTTVTPVSVTPSATMTQAPGFEIVLAAIGMISALLLITRKKK